MSKFLTPESVATRPDASSFSPQQIAKLKSLFDSICKEEGIASEEQCDELAAYLLEASKLTRDEQTLVAVMRYDIAAYKK